MPLVAALNAGNRVILAQVIKARAAFRAAVLGAPLRLCHETSSSFRPEGAGRKFRVLMVGQARKIKHAGRIRARALP
ncbi:hypothetical protein SPHV1_720007 [Novosphingobium sp. KN65.2]|nr:hypothetical protein SPHV1_720007 [Novosphingobium sp. KN65.2]